MDEIEADIFAAANARREWVIKIHTHNTVILTKGTRQMDRQHAERNNRDIEAAATGFMEQLSFLSQHCEGQERRNLEVTRDIMEKIHNKFMTAYNRRIEHLIREEQGN